MKSAVLVASGFWWRSPVVSWVWRFGWWFRSPRSRRFRPRRRAPCSLLTARQVSEVLHVHVRVTRTRFSCTFQGTRAQVFRAVVVSRHRLTACYPLDAARGEVRPDREGRRARVPGQAQNDPPSTGASGLAQSNAQVISGEVVIRLLVTYHNTGLRGVPQLREAMVLADYVGRRLARSR